MLGNIKLDLYVMMHKASTYIILILMPLLTILIPLVDLVIGDSSEGGYLSMFYENSTFMHLYFGIYFVMYLGTDLKRGYIKNIAGLTKSKWHYILSKEIALTVFIVVSYLWTIAVSMLFSLLETHPFADFEMNVFLRFLGLDVLLSIAFMCLMTLVVFLFRNTAGSMVSAIMLSTGLFGGLFYGMLSMILAQAKLHPKFEYISLTLQYSSIDMGTRGKDAWIALAVGVAYIIICNAANALNMEKRDIT